MLTRYPLWSTMSNQRLYNWYLLLLRLARTIKENKQTDWLGIGIMCPGIHYLRTLWNSFLSYKIHDNNNILSIDLHSSKNKIRGTIVSVVTFLSVNFLNMVCFVCLFVWWCLTQLSTIFQLYRDRQFYNTWQQQHFKHWPSQFKKQDKIVFSLSKRHLWITWRHEKFVTNTE
jgi:hypothetical protein